MAPLSNDEKIECWYAEGRFNHENILADLDENIKECFQQEQSIFEENFASISTHDTEGGPQLTEPAFISFLQTKGSLPRSAPGAQAGQIIYASIAYLSNVPFPITPDEPTWVPPSLAASQLRRGLIWILPGRHERITQADDCSRARTPADHRRLIFQSLATALPGRPHNPAEARELARRNAYDVAGFIRDFAAPNYDADGDEMYHDVLDVLYATQPETLPPYASPKRDEFRPVAKRLVPDQFRLHALAIPRQRFAALARVLLALQFEPNEDAGSGTLVELSRFDAAVDSLLAAFCGDDKAQASVVTWPTFDRALKNTAPYLFDPLYRMLSSVFLGRADPETLDASPAPHSPASTLMLPLQSQLALFLSGSIYFGAFRRVHYYSGPDRPTPAALADAMRAVPECVVLVLSGTGPTGEKYTFGVFSPAPNEDGSAIQQVPPDTEGRERCLIFQLNPVHDVFRGAVGHPGWTVGEEGLRFGKDSGVELVLRSGLRRAEITHRAASLGRAGAGIYEANVQRGDWDLMIETSEIEVWGEFLS